MQKSIVECGALVNTVMDPTGFRCYKCNANVKILLFLLFINAPLQEDA
jgi:hypothetical protein